MLNLFREDEGQKLAGAVELGHLHCGALGLCLDWPFVLRRLGFALGTQSAKTGRCCRIWTFGLGCVDFVLGTQSVKTGRRCRIWTFVLCCVDFVLDLCWEHKRENWQSLSNLTNISLYNTDVGGDVQAFHEYRENAGLKMCEFA